MFNHLTLAMNRMKDNNFLVLSYDKTKNKFFNIIVDKSKIFGELNDIQWDILAITECNLIERSQYFTPEGSVIFKGYHTMEEARRVLNLARSSAEKFTSVYSKEIISVIQVRRIKSIDFKTTENGSTIYKLTFISGGKEYTFTVTDNKWRNYWENADGDTKSLKLRLLNYLNRDDKELYLVLYKTGKDSLPYITAIHCI